MMIFHCYVSLPEDKLGGFPAQMTFVQVGEWFTQIYSEIIPLGIDMKG